MHQNSKSSRGFVADKPALRMIPSRELWATLAVMIALVGPAWAKTPDEVRSACRAEGRPCVGLVLSGGGARGFAHVGVLKVLEKLGVKVDVVTGTSMGSMVGGAYAAGYTAEEIEDIVLSVDWDRMLAVRPERSLLPWRRKAEDAQGLSSAAIEINGAGEVHLPKAIVPSQELDIFLMRHTGIVSMVEDLSYLSIPFAASATDLITGERVVMQKNCTLGTAMRASMSVPGAFAPLNYDEHMLVDGGLVDNLPVELAREMGADVIIAVNVGTPLAGRDELQSVVGVMAQMVNLLTEQNVRRSLRSLKAGDVLITPDLTGLTSTDLKRSPEIIRAGEAAAEKARGALAQLARPADEWKAWDEARRSLITDAPRRTEHVISAMRVEGGDMVAPERVIAATGIPLNKSVTEEEVEEGARRVWAEGYFNSLTYRFEPGPGDTEVLVLEPQERDEGYATVRIGGSLETDFEENNNYNVLFSHTWHLLNDWGAEWRNEAAFGDQHRFLTEFYQPIGADTKWFVEAEASYERAPFDVYRGGEPVMRWRNEVLDGHLMLGREFAGLGHAGVMGGWLRTKSKREIGESDLHYETGVTSSAYLGGEVVFDTLDDVDFPTRGYLFSAKGMFTEGDADGRSPYIFTSEAFVPWSVGPWTATFQWEKGRSTQSDAFRLGGAFNMAGVPAGRWTGSDYDYASVMLSRRFSSLMLENMPIWVGGRLEAGRAYNGSDSAGLESADDRWRSSASAYVGLDSMIGPLYLIFGRTRDEGSALYFFWGHPH